MKIHKEYLPQLQTDKIKVLIGSGDFQLLRACIASELLAAEVDLIACDIWIDDHDIAKSQAKNQREKAKKYLMALETLDDMAKEKYLPFTATVTTS